MLRFGPVDLFIVLHEIGRALRLDLPSVLAPAAAASGLIADRNGRPGGISHQSATGTDTRGERRPRGAAWVGAA